jgi:anaerobic selenocysteine-containing dehydrogenase
MQPRIDSNLRIEGEPDAWVQSACLLCSNGCGLEIAVKGAAIVGVRGSANHPVSFGHLGPKGEHGWVANASKRRGTAPMIRRDKNQKLREVSWPEALSFFVERFKAAWASGHQNLACYNSGQLVLEEFYTLAKLWRGGLQSSNIDGNTRLCTASAATALTATFGTDGPVASYADIDQAELICLYGHNVAETQTVLWERMLAARERNGGRITRGGSAPHSDRAAGCRSAPADPRGHQCSVDEWPDPSADRQRPCKARLRGPVHDRVRSDRAGVRRLWPGPRCRNLRHCEG